MAFGVPSPPRSVDTSLCGFLWALCILKSRVSSPSRNKRQAQSPTPPGAPHQAGQMGGPLRPAAPGGLGPAVSAFTSWGVSSRGWPRGGAGGLSEGVLGEKPQNWRDWRGPGRPPRIQAAPGTQTREAAGSGHGRALGLGFPTGHRVHFGVDLLSRHGSGPLSSQPRRCRAEGGSL